MKALHLILALLLSCVLFAQKNSIRDQPVAWGADFSLTKGNLLDYQLETTGNGGYQLWLTPDQAPAALLSFNHEHQLLATELYRMQYEKPRLRFQDFVEGANDTSICFVERDFANEAVNVYTTPYQNGRMGTLKPLHTYPLLINWITSPISTQQTQRWGTTPLSRSPNKSIFAYVEALRPKVVNTQSSFMVIVFDESGQVLWSKRIDKGDAAEYITALDVAVSDRGEVFILAQLHASQTFAVAQGIPHAAGYRMQLFRCTKEAIEDIDVYPNEGIAPLVSRIHLSATHADQVMIAGLYQNLGSPSTADGFFIKRIDLDRTEYTADHYPFAQLDLGDVASTKDWQSRLVLRDYFQFADGSFGIIAEVAYALSSRGTAPTRSYFTHHALIAMFDPVGALQRVRVLDKQLVTSNLAHCSYGLGTSDEQLYFVYNEKGVSLRNRFEGAVIKNQALGTVIRALRSDGSWMDPILLGASQASRDYVLPESAIVTDDHCFFLGQSRKRIRVGAVGLR